MQHHVIHASCFVRCRLVAQLMFRGKRPDVSPHLPGYAQHYHPDPQHAASARDRKGYSLYLPPDAGYFRCLELAARKMCQDGHLTCAAGCQLCSGSPSACRYQTVREPYPVLHCPRSVQTTLFARYFPALLFAARSVLYHPGCRQHYDGQRGTADRCMIHPGSAGFRACSGL
ncbi:hypothetical protein D3C76_1371080 [compost metagenome]